MSELGWAKGGEWIVSLLPRACAGLQFAKDTPSRLTGCEWIMEEPGVQEAQGVCVKVVLIMTPWLPH